VSIRVVVKMALGGHMTDGVAGGKRSTKPRFAPM
jgi:hypothetical protein